MGKSSGSSQREATAEEKALWESQAKQLDALTAIASEQHDLAAEDRAYYESVFREPDSAEAQTAMADLQEKLTGSRPTGSVTSDSLLRDVLVGSSGKLQDATKEFVVQQEQQFADYKGELTGLSADYAKSIQSIGSDYSAELADTKAKLGTIDQGILAEETGAAAAGISTAFAESRKGISAELARRGLTGSGVEASALGQAFQAEAMAKAGAFQSARGTARALSDQQRMQQLGISGQQYQTGLSTAGGVYQQTAGIAGQLYGMEKQTGASSYQLGVAAEQQGIASLQQLQAAGQGTYLGAQNYLQQAASSSAQGAQIAGSSASAMSNLGLQYQQQQAQQQSAFGSGIASTAMGIAELGTGGGSTLLGGFLKPSDVRLKNNIKFEMSTNGINFYSWEWNTQARELGLDNEEPFGVLAQEVMISYPKVVILEDDGFYRVDYEAIDFIIGE